VKNDIWSQFLRRFSANLAVRITDGMTPLLNGALTYLQDLKVYCPEAFDESGSLRPNWEQIVRAKLSETKPVKTPAFHFEHINRKWYVNVN
jgi:hypothetical protein